MSAQSRIGDDAVLLLGVGIVAYLVVKNIGSITQGVASGIVGAAGDAAAGVVTGTASVFGVPLTNTPKCQFDVSNGDKTAAFADCTLAQYTRWAFTGFDTNYDIVADQISHGATGYW